MWKDKESYDFLLCYKASSSSWSPLLLILLHSYDLSLFFDTDLIVDLGIEVFLTDSLVHLAASINQEKEEKDNFSWYIRYSSIIPWRQMSIKRTSATIATIHSSCNRSRRRPHTLLCTSVSSRALPLWIWIQYKELGLNREAGAPGRALISCSDLHTRYKPGLLSAWRTLSCINPNHWHQLLQS